MQTDLSLFLGEAADSFTDWLSQLLNKLQNITAETLEKQFKAQQRAEKTGQGSNSERVLMSLEQKKKDAESVAAAAAAASAKKAKTASDQPPTGDYIAIQTDDVIEGLDEEEIDPPAAKQSRPSSANSRPHSSSSLKKGNDISHKEPPSLVEARQVIRSWARRIGGEFEIRVSLDTAKVTFLYCEENLLPSDGVGRDSGGESGRRARADSPPLSRSTSSDGILV